MKKLLLISFVSLIINNCDETKDTVLIPPTQANINGKVLCVNPNAGFFSDAEINLLPDSSITFSNCSGDFSFANLEPANYTLIISLPGYYPDTSTIEVKIGENVTPSIYLTEIPPRLLKSFSGSRGNNSVGLSWTTETETNNQGFEIQGSNGEKFNTKGFVQGSGTGTQENTYSTSVEADKTVKYFRLKQISFDGSFRYSLTIKIQ